MSRAPRRRSSRRDDSPSRSDASFERLVAGWKRTESRQGREFTVQPVSASAAVKTYTCPGCGRDVLPGVAHVVVWRADGIMGDAADLAARRHWHTACWRIG